MTFEPNKATANVLIDGLSISCFNKANRIWEVGYLRHPLHDLVLDLGTGGGISIPREARVIKIETIKGQKPDYDHEFPLGFLDRDKVQDRKLDPGDLKADDQHNFRWAMNLDQGVDIPHGDGKLKRPPYPVTMVQISDAVFYTSRQSPDNLFLLPLVENPGILSQAALKQKVFGKAADEIGASVMCDVDGGISITVGGQEFIRLIHSPGGPWKINLKNMPKDHNHGPAPAADPDHDHDHEGNHEMNHEMNVVMVDGVKLEQGDFQLYYESVDVTGEKQTFWGVLPVTSSGRTDCNSGWVSEASLAGLFS